MMKGRMYSENDNLERYINLLLYAIDSKYKLSVMGKKRSRPGGSSGGNNSNNNCSTGGGELWGGAKHIERQLYREQKKTNEKIAVTAHLTHNTRAKRDTVRLQLHITKVQRKLDILKKQLLQWDPIIERQNFYNQIRTTYKEIIQKHIDYIEPKKIKKGRGGPTKWTLKGAARPAWQVYDFDVRYIDPHIKAHDDYKIKLQRCINILSVYKNKMGSLLKQHNPITINGDDDEILVAYYNGNKDIINGTISNKDNNNNNNTSPITDEYIIAVTCREYLSSLMEHGYLCEENKHYKSSRSSWLECMILDGTTGSTSITSAKECLFRMYSELKRYDAILRLYVEYCYSTNSPITTTSTLTTTNGGSEQQQQQQQTQSTWVLYAAALASYQVRYNKTYQKSIYNGQRSKSIPNASVTTSTDNFDNDNKNNSSKNNNNSNKDYIDEIINNLTTEQIMTQAIKCNVFAAYYIAYYKDTFSHVMEYTDELQDKYELDTNDDDNPESTFEEALEYCTTKQCLHTKIWNSTSKSQNTNEASTSSSTSSVVSSAAGMLRSILLSPKTTSNAGSNSSTTTFGTQQNLILTKDDVEWDNRLSAIVQELTKRSHTNEENTNNQDDNSNNSVDKIDDSDNDNKKEDNDDNGDDVMDKTNTNNTMDAEEYGALKEKEQKMNSNKKQRREKEQDTLVTDNKQKLNNDENDHSDNDDDESDDDDDDNDDDDDSNNNVDILMYAEMFRTGMEMLQESKMLP